MIALGYGFRRAVKPRSRKAVRRRRRLGVKFPGPTRQNRTKKDEDPANIRSPSVSIFSLSAKFAYDPHPDSSALAAGQVKRQVRPAGA